MVIRVIIYILLYLSTTAPAYADRASQQLIADLTFLSSPTLQGRQTNTLGAIKSAEFITRRFTELGYTAKSQKFEYTRGFFSSATGNNIIAELKTHTHTAPLLVITAHYDHLGMKGRKLFPGANDNASGVSALLYLAMTLQATPPEFNVIFVATDAEENGLHGSEFLVNQLPTDVTVLNINLDMLAVKASKPILYAFTPHKHKQHVKSLSKQAKKNTIKVRVSSSNKQMHRYINDNRIDWRKASDHYSFAKAKIPFVYFGMGADRNHHKATDTIENIDQARYIDTVVYIESFIRQLDFIAF